VAAAEPAMPPLPKPIETAGGKQAVPLVALGFGVLNLGLVAIGWHVLNRKIEQQNKTLLDTMEQKAEQLIKTVKTKTLLERKIDRLKIKAAELQANIFNDLIGHSLSERQEELKGWEGKDIMSISNEFLEKYKKYTSYGSLAAGTADNIETDPRYVELIEIKQQLEILQRQLGG
jgi:hypothetical protein